MSTELELCASTGNLERVKELVEGGAHTEESGANGTTALSAACKTGHFEIVVYLLERGANIAQSDRYGISALHYAALGGNLPTVKYLLEHGAKITERSDDGMTALLHAAEGRNLEVVQYLLSSEGGASITETDDEGKTALLWATYPFCSPPMVQWLLEYGGAQITDTYNEEVLAVIGLTNDKYVPIDGDDIPIEDTLALTAMLRVMVLHGGPPASLTANLAPPLQRIVQDGARLRARLPAYLAQRRALLDAHCPLLPPLQALVHGYEKPTTTDELWATGLGELLQRVRANRPRFVTGTSRAARLLQKR
jgi:hypothetical protein